MHNAVDATVYIAMHIVHIFHAIARVIASTIDIRFIVVIK